METNGTKQAWQCRRCGHAGERLSGPPWPGAEGERIAAAVCSACWGEWLERQTMIINEGRLSVRKPEHRQRLLEEMKVFFDLETAD